MIKGFTMDNERFKGNGGDNYWKELLARIKDIRSSEKVLYRQVLDLYATAVDYNSNDEKSIEFFKIVQNKLLEKSIICYTFFIKVLYCLYSIHKKVLCLSRLT